MVRALGKLSVDAAVTFFVGENGSGKSTILEGIAAAAKLPVVGSVGVSDDETLSAQRALGRSLRLVWRQRTRRGFFLRAEDFFGFTKTLAKIDGPPVPWLDPRKLPTPKLLDGSKLFVSRFVPGGLYLLDEPEAPLSPQSQLALIAMIGDMIAQDAQFIIATHSPILLAFPNALIYSCDRVPIERVRFEELEHVVLTRDFLNAPEKFLRHLR